MLLDDAFLYEICGYASSQKRASVYSCGPRQLSGAVGSGLREHVADLGGELFQREGFGQEGDIAIEHAVMDDSISGVAGRV